MSKQSTKIVAYGGVCLGLALLLQPSTLMGQYYDSPGLGEKPVAAHPQDYKPLGVRAGSFMLHPGIQLGAEFTDNVFSSYSNEQSDTVFHVRPYITAQSTWSRHSLNITAAADYARYADFSVRDYEDYFFGISGRVDVKNQSYFTYSADYLDLHEGLNNRSSQQGIEPTRYTSYGGRIGYDHTFNRLSVGASYGITYMDFDDVQGIGNNIIDNDDRDRDVDNWMLRADYQFQTDKAVFVSYSGFSTNYDQPVDRSGYDRTGDGYTASAGFALTITGKLVGDVSVSYLENDFNDPRLEKVSGWGSGAGLQWNPTYLTSVYGSIANSIQETTARNSSGSLETVYSLRVDHELTRSIQVSGFASYRVNNFQPMNDDVILTRGTDNTFRAGLGANWFINRHMYLNGSYAYETLDSSLPLDDYEVNTFWLLLGLEY